MNLYHITFAVRHRFTFARDERELRASVRALTRAAGERLLLFCLVDDHVHAVLRALARAGLLGRDLRRALAPLRRDLELLPAYVEPVRDRKHLTNLLPYLLRQPTHHGLSVHPGLWTGSCFQDLVGARLLPGFSPSLLAEELPRFRLRAAFEHVGLPAEPLAPASDEALAQAGIERLLELAAGVFALGPDLAGLRTQAATAARALVAGVAVHRLGERQVDVADHLRITRQSTHRLLERPMDPRAEAALRRRLVLEERTSRLQTPRTRPA